MKPLASGDSQPENITNFSLVLGGPLYQLLCRAHLEDDALAMVRQRVVILSLFAWLPLFLLSALQGRLLGGDAAIPFLHDVEAHVRFLAAMPLLIAAELIVHQRMRPMIRQFLERGLVPDSAKPRFKAAIGSAFRLRNSVLAEVLLISVVYGIGVLVIWRHYMALDAATWYATPSPDGMALSWAGIWYGYVSLPLFQFLLLRWYFRLFIWTRFLWQVSRIQLSLVPTHPDRLAGLGFLTGAVAALAPLAAAHGTMLAGVIAGRIFFLGTALSEFKFEIGAVVVLVLCLVFVPLLVFTPQLARAKRAGNLEYGALAERYVREFDTKWLRGDTPAGEPFVGSADIQSLADMANSFEVVRTMRIAPVTRDAVVQLGVTTLAPMAPLTLTIMPLEELLKTLLGILL